MKKLYMFFFILTLVGCNGNNVLYCHRKIRPLSKPRLGCLWENGYAGRLIRTLKVEEVYLNDHEDIIEASLYWAFYHTGVSPETPAFGFRIFDSYGISTKNLILTLRNCGPN